MEFKDGKELSVGMSRNLDGNEKRIILSVLTDDESEWLRKEMTLDEAKDLIKELQWDVQYLERQ